MSCFYDYYLGAVFQWKYTNCSFYCLIDVYEVQPTWCLIKIMPACTIIYNWAGVPSLGPWFLNISPRQLQWLPQWLLTHWIMFLILIQYINCWYVHSADIDECGAMLHSCQQQCINTVGSYVCSCIPGYFLADNLLCNGTYVCSRYRHSHLNSRAY